MKKVLLIGLIIGALAFSGCAQRKTIDNVTYDTYGLFNEDSKQNPNVEYDISVGNVVWSIILFETIIAPVYFIGFDLYEPVGPKSNNPNLKGVVNE